MCHGKSCCSHFLRHNNLWFCCCCCCIEFSVCLMFLWWYLTLSLIWITLITWKTFVKQIYKYFKWKTVFSIYLPKTKTLSELWRYLSILHFFLKKTFKIAFMYRKIVSSPQNMLCLWSICKLSHEVASLLNT